MAIKAQLFITCLAEQFFPDVLKRMVGLLERLGVQVEFPAEQTCCGQPFFNSGYRSQARDLAVKWLKVFGRTDGFIVSPSGSCVDTVRHHFPELFPPGSAEHRQAVDVGGPHLRVNPVPGAATKGDGRGRPFSAQGHLPCLLPSAARARRP